MPVQGQSGDYADSSATAAGSEHAMPPPEAPARLSRRDLIRLLLAAELLDWRYTGYISITRSAAIADVRALSLRFAFRPSANRRLQDGPVSFPGAFSADARLFHSGRERPGDDGVGGEI